MMNNEKKLIYILNHYSNTDATHFTHILYLLKVMADKGVEIVLVIEKLEGELDLNHHNVQIISLKNRAPIVRHIELFGILIKLIHQGFKVSFIRIAASAAIVTALAHRIYSGESYLWQSGTTYEYDWNKPLSLVKIKWMVKSYFPNWLARRLVTWFVTGPEAMVDYYANVVGISKRKIRLLYNDIQLERFDRKNYPLAKKDLLEKYTISPETKILLLVHRLSPVRKTLLYLEPMLEAFSNKIKSNWILFVAGGGSELPAAQELVKKLNLMDHVVFLGNIPNEQITELYASADVFVHPTYTEGFPRVLIEAMAAGLPIISTDAGGTKELMGDLQAHYIVSKDQPAEFTHKVLELFNHPEQWQALSQENKTVVERFSTPTVADMYIRELFHD